MACRRTKNLVQYVMNGGAFVVVHAANNAFSGWPELNGQQWAK